MRFGQPRRWHLEDAEARPREHGGQLLRERASERSSWGGWPSVPVQRDGRVEALVGEGQGLQKSPAQRYGRVRLPQSASISLENSSRGDVPRVQHADSSSVPTPRTSTRGFARREGNRMAQAAFEDAAGLA